MCIYSIQSIYMLPKTSPDAKNFLSKLSYILGGSSHHDKLQIKIHNPYGYTIAAMCCG